MKDPADACLFFIPFALSSPHPYTLTVPGDLCRPSLQGYLFAVEHDFPDVYKKVHNATEVVTKLFSSPLIVER